MLQLIRLVKVIGLSSVLLFTSTTWASLIIPLGLSIDGSLTAPTIDPFGTSSGIGSSTVGGTLSLGTDLAGGPETAILTDIGDGFHLDASISGSDTDGVTYGPFGNEYIIDFLLGIANTSTSDYKVTFDLAYHLFADADGGDAFVQSLLSFDDTITTFMGEDYTSDSFFGDLVNGVDPGTFGEPQGNFAGFASFSIDVGAGTSASLHGAGALRGLAFFGSFIGELEFDLTIAGIEDITPPPPTDVPEPTALGLMLLGLILFRKRIRR